MSLLRNSCLIGKRLLLCSHAKPSSVGVIQRNYVKEPTIDDYDFTHLEGEDQIQRLDHDVKLSDEDRARLAAKYNLRPEDYVPLMDGEITLGDYPRLPTENCLERDPFYDWDDPFHRRNWGEPIFHDMDAYTPVVGTDTRHTIYDRSQMWPVLLGFVGTCIVLFALGEKYKSFLPRAPKQFPEYYPCDEYYHTYGVDYLEGRGTLNATVKDRTLVTHYTFPKKWDPAAH